MHMKIQEERVVMQKDRGINFLLCLLEEVSRDKELTLNERRRDNDNKNNNKC